MYVWGVVCLFLGVGKCMCVMYVFVCGGCICVWGVCGVCVWVCVWCCVCVVCIYVRCVYVRARACVCVCVVDHTLSQFRLSLNSNFAGPTGT